MKIIFILLVIFYQVELFAQIESMRKMAETTFETKAYLVPAKEGEFQAAKGLRLNFTLKVTNEGKEEYPLKKDNFLAASIFDNGKEMNAILNLEKYSQIEIREIKIKTLITRKEKLAQLSETQRADYITKLFGKIGIRDKESANKYIDSEIQQLQEGKSAAEKFDLDRTVMPGGILYFSGYFYLPDSEYSTSKQVIIGNLKYISIDDRFINIPLKAQFF